MSCENNKVMLYNIEYDVSALTQPYFVSDAARDSYFSKKEGVQANYNGVNIVIGMDYQVDLIINFDVTLMDSFNFTIITYNDRNYYCDILDYELVSFGNTHITCRRNVLFEVTNYLNEFEDFNVQRLSTDPDDFSNNSYVYMDFDFRRYPYVSVANGQVLFTGSYVNPTGWKEYFIIFLTTDIKLFNATQPDYPEEPYLIIPAATVDMQRLPTLNGEPKNYVCTFIPIDETTDQIFASFLLYASPYIINVQRVKIPYINTAGEDIPCGVSPVWSGTIYAGKSHQNVNMPCLLITHFEDCKIRYSYTDDTPYNIVDFFVFSTQNVISIECYKYYANGSCSFYLECEFFISVEGVSCVCTVIPRIDNSIMGKQVYKKYEFPFIASYGYTKDAASQWAAENRYYDEITNINKINQAINIGANLLSGGIAGGAEIAYSQPHTSEFGSQSMHTSMQQYKKRQGFKSPTTTFSSTSGSEFNSLNRSGMALGVGNIGRAASGLISGISDYIAYDKNRELIAKQEQEKPDSYISGSVTATFFKSTNFQLIRVIELPFEKDLTYYKETRELYGSNVMAYFKSFNYTNFLVQNRYFIISAIAHKKHESFLTDMQYSELYSRLKNGQRYEVINE